MADAAFKASEFDLSKVQMGDPQIIRVLTDALEAAKAGHMRGIAIIAALGSEAVQMNVAGVGQPQLITGCAQMQRMLLDSVFTPKRATGIVFPAGRG